MMQYQIRRVQPDNWQQLRAVRLRALADAPDAFTATLEAEQQLSDDDWRRRSEDVRVAQFLAIAPNGDSLGQAVGAPYEDREETAGLFSMWVAPEARGLGVGVELVQTVIKWAQTEGYKRIQLDVGDQNMPAIRLYKACGFELTGRTGTLPPPRQHISEYEMERLLC